MVSTSVRREHVLILSHGSQTLPTLNNEAISESRESGLALRLFILNVHQAPGDIPGYLSNRLRIKPEPRL